MQRKERCRCEESDDTVGISDFEEIREKGYYYIDKSGLITDILKNEATKSNADNQTRRFEKRWL